MDLDRRELQCILNAINENIFFKDTNGRYVLSTHVCNMLNSNGDSMEKRIWIFSHIKHLEKSFMKKI